MLTLLLARVATILIILFSHAAFSRCSGFDPECSRCQFTASGSMVENDVRGQCGVKRQDQAIKLSRLGMIRPRDLVRRSVMIQ